MPEVDKCVGTCPQVNSMRATVRRICGKAGFALPPEMAFDLHFAGSLSLRMKRPAADDKLLIRQELPVFVGRNGAKPRVPKARPRPNGHGWKTSSLSIG